MADVKKFKYKKLKTLKKKEAWSKYTPEEMEDTEDQTLAFYRACFTRPVDPGTQQYLASQGGNAMQYWSVWNDFFLQAGIPCVQFYAEDYQCWSTSVTADLCKPQYYLRPMTDIDGNPVENPDANDMVNENTEILNILDSSARGGMNVMWFNGKKWKRVGAALDTAGFVGKADGYSLFVHHIYPPSQFDGATVGGWMVLIAPDDTAKLEDLDKDPAFPLGAEMKTLLESKKAQDPFPMAPRTLNTFAFGWLDWVNDFVNYKGEE